MNQEPFYQKEHYGRLDFFKLFHYKDSLLRSYNYHWHSSIEIIYILKGSIWAAVNGQVFEARPRDMIFVNSGSIHGYWGASPDTVMGLLEVKLELFDELLQEFRDPGYRNTIFGKQAFFSHEKDGGIHSRLECLFLDIRNEFLNKKKGWLLIMRARIYEMAVVLLRELPENHQKSLDVTMRNSNHEIIERVFAQIHKNYSDPNLNLKHVADTAALSKFYFTRFFRKYSGQTFHSYLSGIRVAHAEEMLLESNLTIMDIAIRCGFGSKETFNRIFKLHTGVPPSLYRSEKKAPKP
jgi:AraC-like DNA-binding protein